MIELKQFLESARYAQFWSALNQNNSLKRQVEKVKGFVNSIHIIIARNIATAYQVIAHSEAMSYLGLEGNKLDEFIAKEKWSVDQNGSITLPLHKENEAKTVVISEQIKFNQLNKVIAASHQG